MDNIITQFNEAVDDLIKYSPAMAKKLHVLGYDDDEFVERKLKEIERKKEV